MVNINREPIRSHSRAEPTSPARAPAERRAAGGRSCEGDRPQSAGRVEASQAVARGRLRQRARGRAKAALSVGRQQVGGPRLVAGAVQAILGGSSRRPQRASGEGTMMDTQKLL